MELKKNGIYKFYPTKVRYDTEPTIAIVYDYDEKSKRYSVINLEGYAYETNKEHYEKITSTKGISSKTRELLKALATNYSERKEEEKKYKELIQNSFKKRNSLLIELREETGVLTQGDFTDAILKLIRAKYGSDFDIRAWNKNSVTIYNERLIEKYINPNRYSFVYEEYDRNLFIKDGKAADEFAVKYAPGIIPSLKAKSIKVSQFMEMGDKNTLYANTTYEITFSHGYSQKSVEEIKQKLNKS